MKRITVAVMICIAMIIILPLILNDLRKLNDHRQRY